jgi:hypothetical protein
VKSCKCGSYAINHHCHGRDGTHPDLCDVCFWRRKSNELQERIKRLEEAGDEMYRWITVKRLCSIDCTEAWNKAKEAKP